MTRILIVKLGAMGDVLRTTPLLHAYHRKYGDIHVTWVVDPKCRSVVEGNPFIDELWSYGDETLKHLKASDFDIAINLDKEDEAFKSIEAAKSKVKLGFGRGKGKSVMALNPASEYAVRLGIDDELKFRQNKKTYQQISYEQAELPYSPDEYVFGVSEQDLRYGAEALDAKHVDRKAKLLIGLNTGCGEKFAGKRLPEEHILELSRIIHETTGHPALLLGGPDERERNVALERASNGTAIDTGTHHPIRGFAGIVAHLNLVITGDTIAMHIAIAAKVPALVFFGSTCAPEIELYGRGRKILSSLECAPCYKRQCPRPIEDECMQLMRPEIVWKEAEKILEKKHPVIFLDRDGTINTDPREKYYVRNEEDFKLAPGVGRELKKLADGGFKLTVVSNQAGVGKGKMSDKDLSLITRKMERLLEKDSVRFDQIEYCTCVPEDEHCGCRKPSAGLLERITRKTSVDKNASFMIGDSERDIEAAKRFGVRSVLVLTGKTKAGEESGFMNRPDRVARDMKEAVAWILEQKKS